MRKTTALLAALLAFSTAQAYAAPTDKTATANVPVAATTKTTAPVVKKESTPSLVITSDAPPKMKEVSIFTLDEALASAYTRNPDLLAARATLRATDEQIAQANSGYRPTLAASAAYTNAMEDGNVSPANSSDPKTLALTLSQSVYSGGGTVAAVKQAESAVFAGRARLIAAEQSVLLDGVTAYMDVLRDREIVDLNLSNEKVLQGHLDASSARFKLGAITKTDVSQAEARLAAATASRIAAEGTLKVSRAQFEKIIGAEPDGLIKPTLSIAVPGTLEEALIEAETLSPVLTEALHNAQAAHESTRVLKAGLLPAVDVEGVLARTYDPATGGDDYKDSRSVTIQAVLPLYPAGGATHARIRQAKQVEQQRRRETQSAERAVRESVIRAWEILASAAARNKAEAAQVQAEKIAREGVIVEAKYGSRSTLDVLDAEQEYLNAEVARATSDRNKIVAAYSLLAAVGRLTAAELKLAADSYDPLRNFNDVKDRWAGTKILAE